MTQQNPKPLPQADNLGHRTRCSDSSFYDEVCELCGTTDGHGGRLNVGCPDARPDTVAEMAHYLRSHADNKYIETPEAAKVLLRYGADCIEALGARNLNVTLTAEVNVDLGDELLKDKTPEEQEEMRQGFAKWFDIQRAKSAEIKAVNKPSQRNIPSYFQAASMIDLPGGGVSPLGMDDRDAEDFGVPVEIVEKARATYEAEQAETHLFFMADWFNLARFKRREYVRAVS